MDFGIESRHRIQFKCTHVAGVDEAGRGPLAGPVVAAAVVFAADAERIPGIGDSKVLTEEAREAAFSLLVSDSSVGVGVGVVDRETIDRINILQATMLAMQQAVDSLPCAPSVVLVDGPRAPATLTQHAVPIVKGDAKCYSIAAASIVAKVTRDRIMQELELKYPGYKLGIHKGYGTKEHVLAIQKLGPTPEHRRSFNPLRTWIAQGHFDTEPNPQLELNSDSSERTETSVSDAKPAAEEQLPKPTARSKRPARKGEKMASRGVAKPRAKPSDTPHTVTNASIVKGATSSPGEVPAKAAPVNRLRTKTAADTVIALKAAKAAKAATALKKSTVAKVAEVASAASSVPASAEQVARKRGRLEQRTTDDAAIVCKVARASKVVKVVEKGSKASSASTLSTKSTEKREKLEEEREAAAGDAASAAEVPRSTVAKQAKLAKAATATPTERLAQAVAPMSVQQRMCAQPHARTAADAAVDAGRARARTTPRRSPRRRGSNESAHQ